MSSGYPPSGGTSITTRAASSSETSNHLQGLGAPEQQQDPAALWALAPLIAGRPVLRLQDRDGHYRPGSERPLTESLPERPAAGMILTTSGTVRTLCLDLDSNRGMSMLRRSRGEVLSLLSQCGLEWVEDFSPSGGVHLYSPLQVSVSPARARSVIEALGRLAPSLDPSPHRNGQHGCIRLPGSSHRMGGRQLLMTSLQEARRILVQRNPEASFLHLETALTASSVTAPSPSTLPSIPSPTPGSRAPRQRRISALSEAIAVHGDVPSGYPSASEARMAALCSLTACGWTEDQVWFALRGPELPGLGLLYSKYGSQETIQSRFTIEWSKAQSYIAGSSKTLPSRPSSTDVPKSDINGLNSQGGQGSPTADVRRIKVVLGILDARLAGTGRASLGLRIMLRSLLTFATMTGSLEVAVGCRSHAVATGMHHGTAAKMLKELARIEGSCIRKVARGRGLEADRYVIDVDPGLQSHLDQRSGPRAMVHALRPAFRVLGAAAALVYEALEEGCSGSIRAISRAAGLGASTVHRELLLLATHGLAERTLGGWRLVRTRSLLRVAAELGMIDAVAAQLLRYQQDRARWKDFVAGTRVSDRFLQEWELYDAELEEDGRTGDIPPDPGRPGSEISRDRLQLV